MNKNITKFLILAIILCITVGVASATEASSDDSTAKDAPTITKNTPTTEKIITKTENKKINKNNKTQNVKKDTGNLYVSPDVTEAKTGTNEDPTTIIDAVSKVTQNGNIILLPGTTGVYTPTEQIVISDDTTQADTNKFSFTADNTNIKVDASQVVNLFQINTGYDVTFNNVSINNAIDHAIYVNGGNVTLNGEVTYENNTASSTTATSMRGGIITGTGNVNIMGSNTFQNNTGYNGGGVIDLNNGNLTITGENTFTNNNLQSLNHISGGLIYIDNVNLIINGSNKFINNTHYAVNCEGGAIYITNSPNCTISGNNIFKNNTVNGTGTTKSGGAIRLRNPLDGSNFKIIGENIFEDNHADDANGGAIAYDGNNNENNLIITGNNIFKENSLGITKSSNSRGGAIYANSFNILIIEGTNKFINNTAYRQAAALAINAKVDSYINITGENLFENNTLALTGKTLAGAAIHTTFKKGVTLNIIGSSFINNQVTGRGIITAIESSNTNIHINISENKFINNTATGNEILRVGLTTGDEDSMVTVTKNTFKENTASNETICLSRPCQTTIEDNIFINTTIGISQINLTSEMVDQEIEPNTPITLNYNATLTNPSGYDSDLSERLEYQVYINGENKYNGIGNTIIINEEYTPETQGILNVYVKIDKTISNNITFTLKKPTSKTNITTENPELGGSTELVAQFYDEEGLPITGGKAIFKVNGKTLRNDDGSVVYVDVTNGIAELPDVKLTNEWMKPDTTIQAYYIGTDTTTPIITEKTIVNVVKPVANIELTIPEEASAGETITLRAKVTSGSTNLDSGRVVFKLNGKTLKDADANPLYVNVVDGIAKTTYTIPAKTKAKTYTLSAVFTDNKYERSEKEGVITIK